MVVYDLDRDESIDTLMVNGKGYRMWDIPVGVMKSFVGVRYGLWDRLRWVKRIDKWKPVVEEYLWVFNEKVDLKNWDDGQIFQFINILSKKIGVWEE